MKTKAAARGLAATEIIRMSPPTLAASGIWHMGFRAIRRKEASGRSFWWCLTSILALEWCAAENDFITI